ncbi:RBBP9/YdeN family alpha/beta hydrolase [Sporolactobacillus laevolacticus]|uniref:RBBP9/YdeN family alpha/beta hydrolase n=1 Tax=Sporolactobacillus laevolacticus TaxID=33018 RepID=UPI0025B4970A|nr:alpha/beta fold hydrolase [Sporolactobacillus laevolacticus]MDN3954171.1 alpha/beta fold hydrolase [Sporolactobacillus laevolacticus]
MTNYLVLHGLGGSTNGHWQEWLTNELRAKGENVWFPQLPEWDHPVKAEWLSCLDDTMRLIPEDDQLVVVTHSLGCILWIHYAAQRFARKVSRAIMVCPPSNDLDKVEIQNFFPLPADKNVLQMIAAETLLIASTNDPFLSRDKIQQYFDYQIPCLILPEQGHVNVQSGYGVWPWMLGLCLRDTLSSPFCVHKGV